jgi:phospholipid-binding lipoprotein MlaA
MGTKGRGKKQNRSLRLGLGPVLVVMFCGLAWGLGPAATAFGSAGATGAEKGEFHDPWDYDPWEDDPWADEHSTLADPLEPMNRVFFAFNDRLYILVLEPVASGYAKVLPEDIRLCVRRFFRNLTAPIRVVNHLLQGQLQAGGSELARFAINTTIGVAGLTDPAADSFGIKHRHADLGQTLGIYGFGDGFYITWPLLGPSTLRDSVGMAGDALVNPLYYIAASDPRAGAAVYGGRTVNTVSLHLGEYERMTEAAFDPYLAVRDAYWQYRRNQVQRRDRDGDAPAIFSTAPEFTPARERPVLAAETGAGPGAPGAGGEQTQAVARGAGLDGARLAGAGDGSQAGTMTGAAAMAWSGLASGDCPADNYFIHVGAFADHKQALAWLATLDIDEIKVCLVIHARDDYYFYGLMIPAGDDFPSAKARERHLADRGAPGLLVTTFAPAAR